MAEAQPAIRLSGVRKRFGDFVAVDSVDLSVAGGQVFGLIGPNGAGKTTTLRMITGMLRPSSGTVEVCGVNVVRDPLRAKGVIGFLSDRPYLYEKLTGREFLRFVGGLWGMRRQAIETGIRKWLERFSLQQRADEIIASYSHGMRQRLLLCAALLHQPRLLIMDEPMVGLDPRGSADLKMMMRELASSGVTVVLSTHTLDVVEQVCDALAVIDRGRVVAQGTVAELQSRYHADAGLEQIFLQITAEDIGHARTCPAAEEPG